MNNAGLFIMWMTVTVVTAIFWYNTGVQSQEDVLQYCTETPTGVMTSADGKYTDNTVTYVCWDN